MTVSAEEAAAFYKNLRKRHMGGVTESQKELVEKLCEAGQTHLFARWGQVSPSIRRNFADQLESLDKEYADGGLVGYISNAKTLLKDSREGKNPLEGWTPSVPAGELFELGQPSYDATEKLGLPELGSVGFCLVAGGLGERLGYSNIKVSRSCDDVQ